MCPRGRMWRPRRTGRPAAGTGRAAALGCTCVQHARVLLVVVMTMVRAARHIITRVRKRVCSRVGAIPGLPHPLGQVEVAASHGLNTWAGGVKGRHACHACREREQREQRHPLCGVCLDGSTKEHGLWVALAVGGLRFFAAPQAENRLQSQTCAAPARRAMRNDSRLDKRPTRETPERAPTSQHTFCALGACRWSFSCRWRPSRSS